MSFSSDPARRPAEHSSPAPPRDPDQLVPSSVEELTQSNVERIQALETVEHGKATRSDLVADAIARFSGSITFVWVTLAMIGGWMAWNILTPRRDRLDPFPFPLLTLVLSIEAISSRSSS